MRSQRPARKRKNFNLSAAVCDLLEKLAAKLSADEESTRTQTEVVERAVRLLAKSVGLK